MLERSSYYPGQKSKEVIVLFIRRNWFAYLKWILMISVLLIVPTILLVILFSNGTVEINDNNKYFFIIGISSYLLFLLAIFLTTWIDYYLDVTIITKDHLINIRQDELFTRSVAEQSLLRVQDVTSSMKGFLQTFFRFGTVYVETAGELPNFRMQNIPNPHIVASTIMKIHEELVEEHALGEEMGEGVGMDKFLPEKKRKNEKIEKQEKDITKSEDWQELEQIGEEKIITIKSPNKKSKEEKEEKTIVKKIEKVPDVPRKNSGEKKEEEFVIEKSWVDQKPSQESKKPIQQKNIEHINKNISSQNEQDEVEGEIKEGEEIKF